MNPESIIIFTDGSSRGNPGRGGWGAVVVMKSGALNKEQEVLELGGRGDHTTNNRMEIMAAIQALSRVNDVNSNAIEIFTDSRYLINGITKWVFGWQRNGWITGAKEEVLNRDLWEQLARLAKGKKIEWKYIGGHSGIVGNERCDEIATGFADNKKTELYSGSLEKYGKDILNFSINEDLAIEKKSKKSRSGAKAYSYLSMINGEIQTHPTWALCEARVKGQSGAKFKKALSAIEEKEIIKEWRR